MLDLRIRGRFFRLVLLAGGVVFSSTAPGTARAAAGQEGAGAPVQASGDVAAQPTAQAPGIPFTAEKLDSLLPRSVYFQGRSAPLQIRNAAGASLGEGRIVWASLVDTSGYSTSVQEKYQFYLVSEGRLRVGAASIPAGAYGAGVVGDRLLVMDLGGNTVAETPVQTDAALRRPRPLQMVADQPSSVKLYVGRRWALLQSEAGGTPTAK